MNEQTAALVSNLAAKLGTTSEYLWAVLLKQAPIHGTIMLVQYAATVALVVALWHFRAPLNERLKKLVHSWDYDILVFVFLVIFVIGGVIWLIVCLFSFGSLITAFVNPEYWALKEILSGVKSK